MSEKADLNELASRISDGAPVDWDEIEKSAATDEERQVIRNLRILQDVARVHQGESIASNTDERTLASGEERPDEPAPETWGNLEIRQKVGEGGFGEVYRAWDAKLDREVALKLLKKEPSGRESVASSVIREGRMLARVSHPNVITVYGSDTHDGRVGLWMEFVRGRSLHALLREQGEFSAREAAIIGLDLCRALAAVHRAGLIHRDVKARNVMRQAGGRILLMDFGAGHDLHDAGAEQQGVSGTPLYIAPEIYLGSKAKAQSDIYSLGVLLYHLVTNDYPVKAGSWRELVEKHKAREMRLLRDVRSDLPEAFVNVIERALAWDPGKRFATAGEMEQALSTALGVESPAPAQEAPRRASRGPLIALAAAATLVVGALAVAMLSGLLPWQTSTAPGDAPGVADGPPPAPVEPTVEAPEPAAKTPAVADAKLDEPIVPEEKDPLGAASLVERQSIVPPGSYTVQASLIRLSKEGVRERLDQDARLSLGDWLSLEFEASRDLYLYVINEDQQGHAYTLFPLPDLELQNPIPGGMRHELPGRREGKAISWEVDSVGGREHLMVLASPNRLTEFESEMTRLALASPGQIAYPIPEEMKASLRGIGGVSERPETVAPTTTVDRLFDIAARLANDSEVVRGAWLRRIDLENPAP